MTSFEKEELCGIRYYFVTKYDILSKDDNSYAHENFMEIIRTDVMTSLTMHDMVVQVTVSVYISCITNNKKINQKKFVTKVEISDVTIRNKIV